MRRLIVAAGLILLFACDKPDAGKAHDAEPEPVEATAPPPNGEGIEPLDPAEPDEAPPPGVKTKGNLPVKTESELAAEAVARDECVAECVKSRQAEAKGADAIEADCQTECLAKLPIEQVEVIPDGLPQ